MENKVKMRVYRYVNRCTCGALVSARVEHFKNLCKQYENEEYPEKMALDEMDIFSVCTRACFISPICEYLKPPKKQKIKNKITLDFGYDDQESTTEKVKSFFDEKSTWNIEPKALGIPVLNKDHRYLDKMVGKSVNKPSKIAGFTYVCG